MKASEYIYIVPYKDDRTIVFCGMTHNFLVLEKASFESVALILKNPYKYADSHPAIINLLRHKGFIIEDDYKEIDTLVARRNNFVHSKEYKTTIVSTYDCNYNCWYCIQKHVKEEIDYEKIDLIVKHVKTYLKENEIESYILSWFGGEPLMEPKVIDYVSSQLLEFCEQNDIVFNGAITSNGALLDAGNIEMLRRNSINYYQIAIDGDKENHNRTKKQAGEESSFDTVLSNIALLLSMNEKANVTLRFNYTAKSLKSETLVDDVNARIPQSLRHRISVDFQKVWQVDECSISIDDLASMLTKFHESGYQINSDHVFSICYVDKLHQNMIFYNGGVDKCDNHNIDNLRGYLDASGHIVWKEKPIINDVNPLDEGNCCRVCRYYPLCYGCCPVHREERIIENGKLTCNYEGYFDVFEHRIKDYCIRQMISNNIMA